MKFEELFIKSVQDPRIFRFKPIVDAVLMVLPDGTLWCLPIDRHKFVIVGRVEHPAGMPCLEGEIFNGEHEGLRFFLEPQWEDCWDFIAEAV
jgi:hypothetical protein